MVRFSDIIKTDNKSLRKILAPERDLSAKEPVETGGKAVGATETQVPVDLLPADTDTENVKTRYRLLLDQAIDLRARVIKNKEINPSPVIAVFRHIIDDDLIEELGGKATPAIGFATGIERIILNLKKQGVSISTAPNPQVFIAQVGDKTKQEAIKLASELRRAGIGVLQATTSKSLKAQMKQAGKYDARYVVIVGEEEMASGCMILRDMKTATQETIEVKALQGRLHDSHH